MADEEEEDAAHICREEGLTFPREREVWELLSLSESDGIPACSIMKATGISATAEPSVWWREKYARSLAHGTGAQSWVSFPQLSYVSLVQLPPSQVGWQGPAILPWPQPQPQPEVSDSWNQPHLLL